LPDYDIITVGVGLGGASIAKAMAERGARVLIVEREAKFKDRVRGEWLAPWGVAEAGDLGIYETLISDCGYHPTGWHTRLAGNSIGARDLATTTTSAVHPMTFFHPSAQEALIDVAEKAGAEVRTGVRVVAVQPGATPSVTLEGNGPSESLTARLVIGADGRGSMVRNWGGFESKEDSDQQWLAGILIENTAAPMDYSVAVFNPFASRIALMFPQGDGRARFYFGARSNEPGMSGDREVQRFIEESVKTGMPVEYFEGATPAGPLATFSGADSWVDRPYRDGAALIGDAAAQSDQTWGQGMALTLRDARILRDALVSNDEWDAAGHTYAEEHDRQFRDLHTAESWFTSIFMEPGPEADARRAKALPQVAMDQTRIPDIFFSGPGSAPVDEAARRRFFGEE